MDELPPEIQRQCLEHLTSVQRQRVSIVCRMFAFLVNSFNKQPKGWDRKSFKWRDDEPNAIYIIDIAVDSINHHIIFCIGSEYHKTYNQIKVFDFNGNCLFKIANKSSDQAFYFPSPLLINSNHNIVIFDEVRHCIGPTQFTIFDNHGSWLSETHFDPIFYAQFDRKNNRMLLFHPDKIGVYSLNGQFMFEFKLKTQKIIEKSKFAVDPRTGAMIFFESKNALIFDSDGILIKEFNISFPGDEECFDVEHVMFDPRTGYILIIKEYLRVFDKDGNFLFKYDGDPTDTLYEKDYFTPHAMCIDNDQNIYFTFFDVCNCPHDCPGDPNDYGFLCTCKYKCVCEIRDYIQIMIPFY